MARRQGAAVRRTPSTGSSPMRPPGQRLTTTIRRAEMELQARTYVDAMKIAVGTLAQSLAQLPHEECVEDGIRPDGGVPAEIVRFLAQLRLLQGVPFTYLIADANLI